jgi:hypothetical protein
MKLWWFSGDSGLREWIFAASEERASELYAEVLIMSGAPATKYWGREMAEDAIVGKFHAHYLAAITLNQEGFGEFDHDQGWNIASLADRIEQL